MTITQILVLVLLISILAGITGADLTTNSNFLILLLIALIALSRATSALLDNNTCPNTTLTSTNGSNISII